MLCGNCFVSKNFSSALQCQRMASRTEAPHGTPPLPPPPLPTEGNYDDIRYEILGPLSTASRLKLIVPANSSIKVRAGCMVASSTNMEITGKLSKSILHSKYSSWLDMTANPFESGWVMVSPPCIGPIIPLRINNNRVRIGDNAFLASIGDINTQLKKQVISGSFLSSDTLVVREISGDGIVFVSAVGSMFNLSIACGETVVLDYWRIVSWPSNLKQEFQRACKSKWYSAVPKDGIVAQFTGPGHVNVQTKTGEDIAKWIYESRDPY